jgi:predicted deacylase
MDKKVETILSLRLPYEETLNLQRSVYNGGEGPRVAITAGLHGDELEGLYVCHRLAAWLEELAQNHPLALLGRVELYPGLNPLGLNTLQRAVPIYDSDLNRSFPGYADGLLPQRIAAATLAHLQGSTLVIDVHASNPYMSEMPQVRISQGFSDVLLPLARRLNLEIVWKQRQAVTSLETTLAHSLNHRGVPCLGIKMGGGTGLTPTFCEQLIAGVLNLWQDLGVLDPDLELMEPLHQALVIDDDHVYHLNAITSGLFVSTVENGTTVTANHLLGRIVSPFAGHPLAEVRSPVAGKLITLRRHPAIYEGSLLARIVEMSTAEENP